MTDSELIRRVAERLNYLATWREMAINFYPDLEDMKVPKPDSRKRFKQLQKIMNNEESALAREGGE